MLQNLYYGRATNKWVVSSNRRVSIGGYVSLKPLYVLSPIDFCRSRLRRDHHPSPRRTSTVRYVIRDDGVCSIRVYFFFNLFCPLLAVDFLDCERREESVWFSQRRVFFFFLYVYTRKILTEEGGECRFGRSLQSYSVSG